VKADREKLKDDLATRARRFKATGHSREMYKDCKALMGIRMKKLDIKPEDERGLVNHFRSLFDPGPVNVPEEIKKMKDYNITKQTLSSGLRLEKYQQWRQHRKPTRRAILECINRLPKNKGHAGPLPCEAFSESPYLKNWLADRLEKFFDGDEFDDDELMSEVQLIGKTQTSRASAPSTRRPISLTSTVDSVRSRLLNEMISDDIAERTPNQFAFKKGLSTQQPLYVAFKRLKQAVDGKKTGTFIFCDFKTAYDSLDTASAVIAIKLLGVTDETATLVLK
jgi:hypothetical protein